MVHIPRGLRKYLAGPRILKTGLAVFTCEILFLVASQPMYGAFASTSAIAAILPSIGSSLNQLKKSLTANMLAGLIALIMGLIGGLTPLKLTLAVVLVLYVLVKLNMGEHAGVVSVTMIWMLARESSAIGLYVIGRVGAIAVGTLIGYLINRYIMPPDFMRNIREGLAATTQDTITFGERIATSLADPESYGKTEIKAQIHQIRSDLTLIEQKLHWQEEAGTPESVYRPLEKAKAALFVYVVELARIHKTALTLGGFPPGPIADQLAKTIRAACLNIAGLCKPRTPGEAPDSQADNAYLQAVEELRRLEALLVDDPATREIGLACHGVYTSIQHMERRMRICRGMAEQPPTELPTRQGNPAF